MDTLYEKIIRPLVFRLEPEKAHSRAVAVLRLAGAVAPLRGLLAAASRTKATPVNLFGLHFPNRVGLAAGMDKDAEFVRGALALGFGHVETGTVTPLPQPGNPRPRLFRYPEHEAVVNRMGFNNGGAEAMAARLRRLPPPSRRPGPVGVNIGKNKDTPIDRAVDDYLSCFSTLADYADYFTVNVSSPNTPNLRDLQEKERLSEILSALLDANRSRGDRAVPILLKIAPDLSFSAIGDILEVVAETGIAGLVATNTTISRSMLPPGDYESGGLSGRPLRLRSTEVVRFVARQTGGHLPVIAVGGIHDAESAGEKIDAGASMVQVYTGWIYRGPFFARNVARALRFKGRAW